jgi:anti-sigma regulatory factor (Ser/Thr protein kinase)
MTADQGRPRPAQARLRAAQRTRLNMQVTLPNGDGAARLARQVTRDVLARRRLAHVEDTTVLLVSELVTNAVRHARDTYAIALDLEIGETWLRIEVQDADPRWPHRRSPGRLDESGFGLVLVDALADTWGVRDTATGKAVWAELDTRDPGEPGTRAAGRAAWLMCL